MDKIRVHCTRTASGNMSTGLTTDPTGHYVACEHQAESWVAEVDRDFLEREFDIDFDIEIRRRAPAHWRYCAICLENERTRGRDAGRKAAVLRTPKEAELFLSIPREYSRGWRGILGWATWWAKSAHYQADHAAYSEGLYEGLCEGLRGIRPR